MRLNASINGKALYEKAHPLPQHTARQNRSGKNRNAQMMTPEQAAEEERRFQGQKILASDVDFTLVSNESVAPVICPPVPIGRHKSLQLKSLTVQRLDMLARLVDLERTICDAPLLNKFGLLPAEYWQAVRKVVDGWRYVLTHAHSRKPIGTPKNYQPKNDPLSFYEPQSLAIHQYDKGVAIPIQNWFFSQDKPNQSDKASGSKMSDQEVSQEDTESTHHPKQ
jgi:hypothetical protein